MVRAIFIECLHFHNTKWYCFCFNRSNISSSGGGKEHDLVIPESLKSPNDNNSLEPSHTQEEDDIEISTHATEIGQSGQIVKVNETKHFRDRPELQHMKTYKKIVYLDYIVLRSNNKYELFHIIIIIGVLIWPFIILFILYQSYKNFANWNNCKKRIKERKTWKFYCI